MDSSRFDKLTKALATPTSRRQALVRIGGTLSAALLASWPFSHALASNSACAKFCDAVFGADTAAASQCISDAAHGKGLCQTCGSAAPSSICCIRNGSGFCTSYSGAHCPCTSGQGCCSGTCTDLNTTSNCGSCGTTCTGTTPACCSGSCKDLSNDVNNCGKCGNTCPSGQTCQNGQCICVSPPPPPPGLDALICFCNDGTNINLCVVEGTCLSGPAQDVFCGPACQCHGGESGTLCFSGGCGR